MSIPLEDGYPDVLIKAARGRRADPATLARLTGLDRPAIESLLDGTWNDPVARKVCAALQLDHAALAALALGTWKPSPVIPPEGVFQANTPFGDMTVNAYLVWDPASRHAAMFDTGGDAGPLLRYAEEHRLTIRDLFLTHTHGDHVFDTDRVREKTGCTLHAPALEPFDGAKLFEHGEEFRLGGLRIETRLTCGHSPGGTTYVIHGLERPLALVGDALFAGSMGGPKVSYRDSLATNRKEIFSLPNDTLLGPGHGPWTTVGQEKRHNPFFAGAAP
jgi:glyoxylase-like metal-dependent hydrolase (beta-lactamase superfamily II)